MLYGNALEGPNLDGVWPSISDVRKFYQLFTPSSLEIFEVIL